MNKKQARELLRSITKFGLCQPIVVNQDLTIIGGHQRYEALRALNKPHVDVAFPSEQLSPSDVKELTIRLNKNQGEWDFDLLANEFEIDQLLDAGFDLNDFELEQAPETKEKQKSIALTIKIDTMDNLDKIEKGVSGLLRDFPACGFTIRVS